VPAGVKYIFPCQEPVIRATTSFSGTSFSRLIVSLSTPLHPVTKTLPPSEEQLSNESLKFWSGVTNAIVDKQFSQATNVRDT
jgi:hypothetical protein